MTPHKMFTGLLAGFAQSIGLPPPAIEDGVCMLELDGQWMLNLALRPGRDQLVVFAPLGVPAGDAEPVYQALLRANDTSADTVLALDVDSGQVVATAHVPLDGLDVQGLQRRLERFVDAAAGWRERLAGAPGDAAAPQDLAGAPFTFIPFDRA